MMYIVCYFLYVDLINIPSRRLSLKEAARTQSIVDVVSCPVDRSGVCVKVRALIIDTVVEKLNRNVT